jgi:hypothetical protein
MKECIAFLLHASQTLFSATIRWAVSLDRTLRVIDVRQIGPDSERDISGRCSSNLEALRSKLEKLLARNLTETACGKGQDPPRNRASSTRQSKFLPQV